MLEHFPRLAQIGAALLAGFAFVLIAEPARAVDSIYWGNYESNTISHANLAGGGGGELSIVGPPPEGPYGMAIDAALGKIYWINLDAKTIEYANLDGSGAALLDTSGATVSEPSGLAIDPAAGRVYWANHGSQQAISYANLNGSGGGDLNTGSATLKGAYGVAVYPAAGRIYWANYIGGKISYANLDGSGGGDIDTTGVLSSEPIGIAVDAANGKIYWPEFNFQWIGFANLGGGSGGALEITNAPYAEANGLAIDGPAGRIYWANSQLNSIGVVNTAGGGDVLLDTAGAMPRYPTFPVLLESPRSTEAPTVHLSRKGIKAELECSKGGWAGDLLESFLYRVPQSFSFQWLRNGKLIAGASAGTYTAAMVGHYSCRVTAANYAGPTSQTSSAAIFSAKIKLGRARVNQRKGTATLPVKLTGPPGPLALTGKKIAKRRRAKASGKIRLLVRARGKASQRLNSTGKAKVKVTASFTPAGATKPLKRTKAITLKKRLSR